MSVGKICFSTDSLKSSVTTLLIKAELGLRNVKVLVLNVKNWHTVLYKEIVGSGVNMRPLEIYFTVIKYEWFTMNPSPVATSFV